MSAPIRLSVHRDLRRLFLPRNALTLETERNDRVLTVYGEFTAADGSMVTEDITAHPYLRYDVRVTGGAPSVSASAGRIASGNAPGTVEIVVSVDPALNQPAPAVTMSVTIIPAVTDRSILSRFHTGTAARKKSILFVPDGYTAAQQAEFNTLALEIGRKLLRTISPFRHLRESFDLYTAFVPSAEAGVTIGPPIIAQPGAAVGFALPMDRPIQTGALPLTELLFHLGHPAATSAPTTLETARTRLAASKGTNVTARELPQSLYDLWQSLRRWPPQSRVRETFFGIMMDERHHGTAAIIEDVPPPAMPRWPPLEAAIHLTRRAVRLPLFDERRLPDLTTADPNTAHVPALSRFVKTLRVPDGPAGLGAIWAPPPGGGTPAGDSFGLVVILARSEQIGALRLDGCLLVSTGAGSRHSIQPSTVIPRLLEVALVPRPISVEHDRLGFMDAPLDVLVNTVAHEIAHSVSLGKLNDEYGEGGRPPNQAILQEVTFVEQAPNTQLIANARAGIGPGLNGRLIKWNWERVEGAARVETIRADGVQIVISVSMEDARRWPMLSAGRLLTLRGENLGGPVPGSTLVGSTPASPAPQSLTLVSFDLTARTIRCTVLGAASLAQIVATFPPGSVLVVPRLLAGASDYIIPGALVRHLAGHGPFSPSGNNCAPAHPVKPPTVIGFAWPRNQLQAVAAYEVGALFNCGVIHPAGECKMGTINPPTEFCYVCKYAMVYAIDPALLAAIDREYP
jgi:hypothetical protein